MRVRAKLLSEAQEADEAMKADVAFLLRLSKPEVCCDSCGGGVVGWLWFVMTFLEVSMPSLFERC